MSTHTSTSSQWRDHFGKLTRHYRKRAKYTRKAFAAKVGLSEPMIQKAEQGDSLFSAVPLENFVTVTRMTDDEVTSYLMSLIHAFDEKSRAGGRTGSGVSRAALHVIAQQKRRIAELEAAARGETLPKPAEDAEVAEEAVTYTPPAPKVAKKWDRITLFDAYLAAEGLEDLWSMYDADEGNLYTRAKLKSFNKGEEPEIPKSVMYCFGGLFDVNGEPVIPNDELLDAVTQAIKRLAAGVDKCEGGAAWSVSQSIKNHGGN